MTTPTPLATAASAGGEPTPASTPVQQVASPTPGPTAEATPPDIEPSRNRGRTRVDTPPARVAALDTPEPAEPASTDYSFLEAELDRPGEGRELGRDLSSHYGGRDGGFGTQRQLRARPRGPIPRHPGERVGLRVTHGLMLGEATYRRRTGRYGGLAELRSVFPQLRVAAGQHTFQYRGYRFELSSSADSYKIMAVSLDPGLRTFTADSESDYITVAGEE